MSVKQIGVLNNWTLQPGYPQKRVEDTATTMTYIYTANSATVYSEAPSLGATCPGDAALKLNNYSVDVLPGGALSRVTLTYKNPDSQGYDVKEEGQMEISMSCSPLEKDIEYHPNYLACWNHFLAFCPEENTTTPKEEIPSDWNTLKKPIIENKPYWRFFKTNAELPDGWIAYNSPTKKAGLTSYVMSCPTIRQKIFYKSYSSAVNAASAADVGDWGTPEKTFGKVGYWLIMGIDVQQEGKYWTVTSTFQFSNIKDDDIYPVPADSEESES